MHTQQGTATLLALTKIQTKIKDFMYQPHKQSPIKCQYAILGSGENEVTVVLIDERDCNAGYARVVILKKPLEFNKNKEVEGLEEYAFIKTGGSGSRPNIERDGMTGSDKYLDISSNGPYLGTVNVTEEKDWLHSKPYYYFKLTELAHGLYHNDEYAWITSFFKSNKEGNIIHLKIRFEYIEELAV